MSSAEAAKAEGNAAWKAGDNDKAIEVRGLLIGRKGKSTELPALSSQSTSQLKKKEPRLIQHISKL